MKKTVVMLTMLGLALGGCTALEKTNEAVEKVGTVTQTVQTMLDINSIKGQEFTLENSDITISFDNTRVYGFSGVNRYFGGLTVQGSSIVIENIASTMMAGPQDKMEEEASYLKTLAEMTYMRIEGKSVILTGNGKTLKFLGK